MTPCHAGEVKATLKHCGEAILSTMVALRPDLSDPMPPWRIFFDPRGRIGRATFWLYGVGALLGLGVLGHLLLGIARVRQETADHLINLLLAWPVIATSGKRWHDRDRSGAWVLVLIIPVIGWIWTLIENGCRRGTTGPNRFGPDPLGVSTGR
jgi:uncharacterized membrane protein YhaH (DUF805 family)